MKYFVTFFIFCAFCSNAQMRLIWTTKTKDLNFLKDEKQLKLTFNLDSFYINDVLQSKEYVITTSAMLDSVKGAFEKNFNKVKKKKIQAFESVVASNCNYILKVSPLKFYYFQVNYRSVPAQNGYPGWPACSSIYIKGDFLIEIINNQSSNVIASFSLTNLTNKYPMSSNCGKNKYSDDLFVEIYRSMIRAGTESAKYILKLKKKSKTGLF
ncbi:MAG: hypothetical protein C0448_14535 [Sphingobacteriaceae bacterium]|nr:hypothetical protein [Sphingobacteriaceae bacterium]